jgi:dipeptidase
MCDALVAGGEHTRDGVLLFAKNSDRKALESQPFLQFPAAAHPPGSRVRCTHVEIPQVAETYRVMGHSPWWVWGFEHGVNEHAVAIGNLTVFSREPIEEKPGLIGMDLVRLGLERGRTAREALEIIAGLIEAHGQGGAAIAPDGPGYHNAFVLADPDEGWFLETSNRRWAARRVRLGTCSNHMALARDWEIGSTDLELFARSEGFWQGEGRIDVAAAYRNPHVPGHISEGRQRRSQELLRRGAGAVDVPLLQSILRDHAEAGPIWAPGPRPEEERYWTVCAHSDPVSWTTASLVAPLPHERSQPWPVWISFGTPCTGVFLPVYLDAILPPELARGGSAPDPESAWWTFKALQDAVLRDPLRLTPLVREAWAAFESKLEAERLDAEARARASRDPDLAAAILGEFMARATREAMTRARELGERVASA